MISMRGKCGFMAIGALSLFMLSGSTFGGGVEVGDGRAGGRDFLPGGAVTLPSADEGADLPVLAAAWLETPTGRSRVGFDQDFYLVFQLKSDHPVLGATLHYAVERSGKWESRSARASLEPVQPVQVHGGAFQLRVLLRLSPSEGTHLHLEWRGLSVETEGSLSEEIALPADLPVRRIHGPFGP